MSSILKPVSATSIRWLPGDSKSVMSCCPVCRVSGFNIPQLEIPSHADGAMLALYGCSACGSRFFVPGDVHDFSEILGNGKQFWKGYVEVVGGIWEMYWPAACASRKPKADLLDVGCGFGFTVDAWRRSRGDAVGVELAGYGRAGAELLGIPIHSDYLQDVPALQSRRFDVVYASEVIEHVPDPREFAALLSRHVAEDGVLCLTTPSAEFIGEKNAGPTLVAALSPGFHGFLIGPVALREILRGCGFAHVIVRQFGERLIAWASRHPLDIDENAPEVRAQYLGYLDMVLASRTENDVVTDGIAYRHFRDMMLSGQVDAARRSLARLEVSLQEKYGVDVLDPVRTLARAVGLKSAEDYDAAYPWFLSNFYFVRGVYAKMSTRDEEAARQYFRVSRELATHVASSWGLSFALEALSFVPEAWQQEAVSAAMLGDPSVCVEWIGSIAADARRLASGSGGNGLTNRQIELAYLEGLSILGALNRPEALGKALQDCLEYLDGAYGDWLRAGEIASTAIPGAGLQHEQRLLLHLKIAATCRELGFRTELVRPLLERVIQLGKTQQTPSATANAMTAEARRSLAAMSPTLNPWANLNAGITGNVTYSFRPVAKTRS